MLSRQIHCSQLTFYSSISQRRSVRKQGLFFFVRRAGGVRQRQKTRHLPARQQWSRVIPCVVYKAITSASKQRLFAVASVCETLSAAICFFIDFDHIKNGQASSCQCLAHRGVTLTHHAVPPLGDALKA